MGGVVPRLNLRRTTRRFSRVAFAGLLAVAWFAPVAIAQSLTVSEESEWSFTVAEASTVYIYGNSNQSCSQVTVDPYLWLYDDNGESSGQLIAQNDDGNHNNQDQCVSAKIVVELEPGDYLIRAGYCCQQLGLGARPAWGNGVYELLILDYDLTTPTTTSSTTTTSEVTTTTSEATATTAIESTTSTELETTTTSSEPESTTTITEPASTTTLVEETWPPTTESTVPTTTVTTSVPMPIVPVIPPTTPSTVSTTSSTQPATTSQPPETSAPSSVVSSTEPESDPTTVETDPPLEVTQAPAEPPLESAAPVVPSVPTVSNDAPTAPPPTETTSTTTTPVSSSATSVIPTAPPNNASEDDKREFEQTVNVFDGSFDDYIPAGSNVTVAQRRTIVAVTTAVSFLAPVATQRRKR